MNLLIIKSILWNLVKKFAFKLYSETKLLLNMSIPSKYKLNILTLYQFLTTHLNILNKSETIRELD